MGESSYRRRTRFAGEVQFRLATALGPSASPVSLRGLEWLSQSGFDAIECLRAGSMVPSFGRPAAGVLSVDSPVPQHPRYLGYWWDEGTHSMVGLHIGIDLLRHQGRYYPLEFNLGAALRPTRRRLYSEPIDPLVVAMAEAAGRSGFRHVRCYAAQWSEEQKDELASAGRNHGLDMLAVTRGDAPGLPDPLVSDTFHVVFDYQHSPLHFLVTNQACTSTWLYESIARDPDQDILGRIETSPTLWVPPETPGGRWPNLVVKLGGGFSGKSVAVARVRSEQEALEALGMEAIDSVPQVFRRSPIARIRGALGRHQRPLFQQFIPPELDEEGRPRILRAHVLLSPRQTRLLSAHQVVSREPLPEEAPAGLIADDGCYIVNFSKGARYALADRQTHQELEEVITRLGEAADRAIRARFEVEA